MPMSNVDQIIDTVRTYCEKNNARFTPPREAVLKVIAGSDQPLGAYDILANLNAELDNPKPPTIYRAIDFLEKSHFIHRIESLNAYVICDIDHRHSGAQFMICEVCKKVMETHQCHIPESLQNKAESIGFDIKHWISELHGTCADCMS